MNEPTIICPKCKAEIKLTESLAAPLVERTRKELEGRMAERESGLQEREAALRQARENMEEQLTARIGAERTRIAAEEAKKAQAKTAGDLEQQAKEMAELKDLLKQKNAKLGEAQQAQAELIRKQRELEDARREMELTIEKRVQESLSATRDQARKEAEESLKLKVLEKEQTITGMQRQIEELKRRAEQGSQQLQGEVQELALEGLLKGRFPHDVIEPVAKGEYGGDVLQRVVSPTGQPAGSI